MFMATIISVVIILSLLLYFWLFLRAKISVEVEPENAVVTVGNAPLKVKDGKAKTSVKLGKHTVKVEADDYVGFKEEITLSRGKNYSKKISLNKAPVPVEIAGSAEYIALSAPGQRPSGSATDNEVFYRDPTDKLIYRSAITYTADGQAQISAKEKITAKPIGNVNDIIWSPTKELLLLKRGRTANLFDFRKYDFLHQAEALFSNDVGDIAWSPDNSRVAYVYQPQAGERTLIFSDKTNQTIYRAADLRALGIENPYIAFSPDSAWLVIIPRNSNFADNKIYTMSIYTKELRKINDAGSQKEAVFSSDSAKIIYSTFSTDPNNFVRRDLSLMKLDGSDNKSLGIQAKATNIRLWSDPNKIFLLGAADSGKLKLIDLLSGNQTDFYFKGQSQANISEFILNNDKTGAVFVSIGKLYFVKLTSN